MYKLYYSPGACSMAVHVVMNEIGVPFEASKVDMHNKSAEFLKVNPRGQVPTLVADGQVILEGAAQMMYLMDSHPNSLMPKSGKERATALHWLMLGNATLHPAYSKVFFIMKNVHDEKIKAEMMKVAIDQINVLWAEIDAQLAKTPYVCGKNISAADILFTVIANWAYWLPNPDAIKLGNNVKRLIKEVIARPSYAKAIVDEQVEYKAAA